MNTDRIKELEGMIEFADELIDAYKYEEVEVPKFVYDKIICVYDELIGVLKEDTARLNAATEVMRSANKVFENKGVKLK